MDLDLVYVYIHIYISIKSYSLDRIIFMKTLRKRVYETLGIHSVKSCKTDPTRDQHGNFYVLDESLWKGSVGCFCER